MATSQLLLECLIADGFPKNQNTSDVANYFRATTGVPAVRLALLPSGRWVFQVCSHSGKFATFDCFKQCPKIQNQKYQTVKITQAFLEMTSKDRQTLIIVFFILQGNLFKDASLFDHLAFRPSVDSTMAQVDSTKSSSMQ